MAAWIGAATLDDDAEREKLAAELAQTRQQLEESEAGRRRAERRLEQLEVTQQAWREAAQATNLDVAAVTRQAEARVGTKMQILQQRADAMGRDNAQLSGQLVAYQVAETVILREVAMLDGLAGLTGRERQAAQEAAALEEGDE